MEKVSGGEKNLYQPLVARIHVSRYFPDFFYDKKALELESKVPCDEMFVGGSEFHCLTVAARAYHMDRAVTEFIKAYEVCNIIYLGCGLETAYHRINSQTAMFYHVDSPEVIKLRQNMMGTEYNEMLIEGNIFKIGWANKLDSSIPTMVVVEGALLYCEEKVVVSFVHALQRRFMKLALLFDVVHDSGLRFANRFASTVKNKDEKIIFSVRDSERFVSQFEGARLVEEILYMEDISKTIPLSITSKTKLLIFLCDLRKRASILHLQFKGI